MAFLQPATVGKPGKPPMFKPDVMLEPQYKDAYELWKRNPSPHTTGQLLKTISPEIDRGILAHVGSSNPLIRSRAKLLTLRAFSSYDPKQAKLGTHIVNHLQGLKRVARQQAQILPVPERVALDSSHIERARTDLEDRLGREASMQELSDYTGLSIRRITHVQKFRKPVAEGTVAALAMSEEGGGSAGPAVAQSPTNAWLEMVYMDQDGVNQKIMEWTLGLHGQPVLPNNEIARRLRISQGAVSQRKARIQDTLNQEELNPFHG